MGTINYKTSDYITLSIKPYDFEDIKAGMIKNYPELIEENTIKDGTPTYRDYEANRHYKHM